jgi:hypothetical protein
MGGSCGDHRAILKKYNFGLNLKKCMIGFCDDQYQSIKTPDLGWVNNTIGMDFSGGIKD